jgi:hypothetical protein
VRYAWRANLRRAKKVDYVLAVYNGEIVGAFTPTEWLSAIPANFPDFPTRGRGESAFVGTRLPQKSRPDIFANVPRLRNVETRGNSTITGAVD